MNGTSAGGAFSVVFLIFLLLYFVPTVVAVLRKHKDLPAIAAINILLGWSVIGWFISFIWSLSDPSGRNAAQTVIVNTMQHNQPPPPRIDPEPAPHASMFRADAPPPIPSMEDADVNFWDRLPDKRDPDGLEEYLVRFPTGRFSQLARNRLDRLTSPTGTLQQSVDAPVAPDAPATVAAEAVASSTVCSGCNAALPPKSRFCVDCGAAVAA